MATDKVAVSRRWCSLSVKVCVSCSVGVTTIVQPSVFSVAGVLCWTMKMLLLLLLATVGYVGGYPTGPPETACGHMFPTGHGVDAQTIEPPYSLDVSPAVLSRPNQMFNVTVRVKGVRDFSYFEGMFVQARMASCYKPDKPVGSFQLMHGDTFSKLMNCHKSRPGSAVAQNVSRQVNAKIQFYWISPSSMPGHIYFRATVVKNQTTFWTDVFSPFVRDTSDKRALPTKYCEVCQVRTCKASSIAAATSLIVAALAFSFFWV